MEVMSLFGPGNTNSVEADLACELCHKNYQRRLFLLPQLTASVSELTVRAHVIYSCAIADAARVPKG
jgi:hypothetical protein